jgi:hypothetical protein
MFIIEAGSTGGNHCALRVYLACAMYIYKVCVLDSSMVDIAQSNKDMFR